MSAVRNETLLQAVSEVARLTGRVALAHFRTRLDVETKRDGSPVTIADRAAEQTARKWIAARFPHDAILGEEFGPEGDPGASAAGSSTLSMGRRPSFVACRSGAR